MTTRGPAFTAHKKDEQVETLRRQMWAGFRATGLDQDEGARHALLLRVVGATSTRGLNRNEMRYVIEALKQQGFDPNARKGFRKPVKEHSKKIWALWFSLRDAGALEVSNGQALRGWIRRMMLDEREAGISVTGDPDMLDNDDAQWIIESLKQWARRVGAKVL